MSYWTRQNNAEGNANGRRTGGHVRVCFISHSWQCEGAEKALLETIEILKDEGIECAVFVPGPGAMVEELIRLKVPYCILPFHWWVGAKTESLRNRVEVLGMILFETLPMLEKAMQWRPDVIYSNTKAIVVGALMAYVLRRPHVWHLHEFGEEDHGLAFTLGDRISYRLMDSLSSICITNSRAVTEKYAPHISTSKLRQIYYSMHCAGPELKKSSEPPSIPPRKFPCRCVIVGRFSKGKGHQDAIEAMAELPPQESDLLVVGSGTREDENYLRSLVRQHRLEERVIFIGQVRNVLPFVQSADIALMCSRAEAFGRVTVEAMLAGKPVIGANGGGTPELIQEGVTGLLYRPGDPKDLAEKIKYLCQDPLAAKQMGVNGREWARATFTKSRYRSEILAALHDAVGSART
jgi:glycosyltransferase involved in cell wall biosynthesis